MKERAARGRAARSKVPRSEHADWEPSAGLRAPEDVLLEQAAGRVAELVPIRHGRMLESPFAFFRGAAALMAADLAETPQSGLRVQLCGDAHLSNFGGFAGLAVGLLVMGARRQRDLEASLHGDTHRPISFGLVAVFTVGGVLLALATIVLVVAQT